jgi:lipopolysaccharide export system ATP-binding protein
MSEREIPGRVRQLIAQLAARDRSSLLALHAILMAADENGTANFHDVAIRYREDTLAAMRREGRDMEREASVLGVDQARSNLADTVIPRLASEGVIAVARDPRNADGLPIVTVEPAFWADVRGIRENVVQQLWQTGEHVAVSHRTTPSGHAAVVAGGSVLAAEGLVKMYRRRRVVNDVALRLQQGEIVGLLGPNGAGKTTTFYMIVGLIQPLSGRILLDGTDITSMPMYKRARQGIGYLSQEPSIFRKLTVEENILAILETLKLSTTERKARLETLLDELSIKHLRHSKAFALSGGERRRLEITRALVTQPKFMMLDEPFAGVDPIAVHDIQTIVAGLRKRRIGVLISDHNVEQTLDIVDRAYIMFDGRVRVSGTVRELVFDDEVARVYLGPTLASRLRARFSADNPEMAS